MQSKSVGELIYGITDSNDPRWTAACEVLWEKPIVKNIEAERQVLSDCLLFLEERNCEHIKSIAKELVLRQRQDLVFALLYENLCRFFNKGLFEAKLRLRYQEALSPRIRALASISENRSRDVALWILALPELPPAPGLDYGKLALNIAQWDHEDKGKENKERGAHIHAAIKLIGSRPDLTTQAGLKDLSKEKASADGAAVPSEAASKEVSLTSWKEIVKVFNQGLEHPWTVAQIKTANRKDGPVIVQKGRGKKLSVPMAALLHWKNNIFSKASVPPAGKGK